MAEIGFDSQALGISTLDDQSADVSGPMSAYAIPMMVRRKFIGETTQKIVCLSDIYRIPGAYGCRFAEYINSGKGEIYRPNWVKPKTILDPAGTIPGDFGGFIDQWCRLRSKRHVSRSLYRLSRMPNLAPFFGA
jgi:hypothetical protein